MLISRHDALAAEQLRGLLVNDHEAQVTSAQQTQRAPGLHWVKPAPARWVPALPVEELQRILDRLRGADRPHPAFSPQTVQEAIARVLGEHDGLPPGPAEVDKLIRLLRAYLVQMVPELKPLCEPQPAPELHAAIEHASRMWHQEAPPLFVDRIKYLIGLAQATAELLAYIPERARVECGAGARS